MKNPEKLLLRVQIPFDKEIQIGNFDYIIANILHKLHEKALPHHKYLMMNFVLSHESSEPDEET